MTLICPTDVVEAPVDVVWGLLAEPAGWGDFFDLRVREVDPPGRAHPGQRLHAESGPWFLHLKIGVEFTLIDPTQHRLGAKVVMPLGIVVTEDMRCTPIDADRCRVTYGCDFSFPAGWRGSIVQLALRREVRVGPAESLARLKAAAEKAHRLTLAGR
ncbi:MAG TPA: SRPBCC family protein [Caulobacteraceae bacterium]|nr:SRPBCC family protein [Caulobacteraceae bacterium]